jgi:hypothetical protein
MTLEAVLARLKAGAADGTPGTPGNCPGVPRSPGVKSLIPNSRIPIGTPGTPGTPKNDNTGRASEPQPASVPPSPPAGVGAKTGDFSDLVAPGPSQLEAPLPVAELVAAPEPPPDHAEPVPQPKPAWLDAPVTLFNPMATEALALFKQRGIVPSPPRTTPDRDYEDVFIRQGIEGVIRAQWGLPPAPEAAAPPPEPPSPTGPDLSDLHERAKRAGYICELEEVWREIDQRGAMWQERNHGA